MFRKFAIIASVALFGMTSAALGADVATSASVGGSRSGPGAATATAHYEGDVGFARTTSNSGKVNLARGVAVGFDEDGLSLSVSNAIATRRGPAIATNFNLSIDRDGDVSSSSGIAVANGPFQREASAGGSVGNRPGQAAISTATGKTDPFGRVSVETRAEQHRAQPVVVIRRPAQERRDPRIELRRGVR